ncbi:MAG: CDP-alcohol phosphatidyltransferase family protein [Chthoniobacterales bacterium]|nr:CDP-alcohol phosphatidyltransferase family protein [Chthoniobacterales bacterium]
MPAPSETAPPSVEASYKARSVEGVLDLYFYRKIGYRIALLCARLRITPAQVTWCGAALGVLAGHLYFYRDLRLNLLGMLLHVGCNAFDNADGQLARLTKKGSGAGRALDGLADNLVFFSVYAHLCLRYTAGGGTQLVWLLALSAGASHSMQSAAADYFRNAYLYFAEGKARAELDSSHALQEEFDRLRWSERPWKKFLLRLYLNYTRQQEWLCPSLAQMKRKGPDEAGANTYRDQARPLIKWTNLLATNPRMILLFALLLAGQPVWYFWIELTFFNIVFAFLLWQENAICRQQMMRVTNS